MSLALQTPIVELHLHDIGKLSGYMAGKLAVAVASFVEKSEPDEATVEDLLSYFPLRYEDRSNLARIDEIGPGVEASVELYTRSAGAFQVKNSRAPRQNLFIYEVVASDRERTMKPVLVWWFLSGKNAKHIIQYYDERFGKGSRFVAHGEWRWSERRQTFELKLQKPDELEMLPNDEASDVYGLLKPGISAKNVEKGRRPFVGRRCRQPGIRNGPHRSPRSGLPQARAVSDEAVARDRIRRYPKARCSKCSGRASR
jgi:hypothetical protein